MWHRSEFISHVSIQRLQHCICFVICIDMDFQIQTAANLLPLPLHNKHVGLIYGNLLLPKRTINMIRFSVCKLTVLSTRIKASSHRKLHICKSVAKTPLVPQTLWDKFTHLISKKNCKIHQLHKYLQIIYL